MGYDPFRGKIGADVYWTATAPAAINKSPPKAKGLHRLAPRQGPLQRPHPLRLNPLPLGRLLIGLEITFFAAFGVYASTVGF